MTKKEVKALEEELISAYSSLARMASSDSSNRASAKKHYEGRRRLENAIRRHTSGACNCRSTRGCLSTLARLVPLNPRPKYGQRKKVATK